MHFSLEHRELTLKFVYYGPALSGKTTNLQSIHQMLRHEGRGKLMTLDTVNDRTLFFDLLPVFLETSSGFKVKLKLFTVPGQVIHNSTRKLVLAGADGVAFIADSQRSMTKANNNSWLNMVENLRQNGLNPDETPMVIQFNKRDLADIKSDEEIDEVGRRGHELVFRSVAVKGVGVFETLIGLAGVTWSKLDTKLQLESRFKVSRDDFLRNLARQLVNPNNLKAT